MPPLPREKRYARELPWRASLQWLRAGWSDLRTNPLPSLLYGLGVFIVSLLVVGSLFRLQISHFVFPALAEFMVLGPLIANGLYEKSRRLENGDRVTFGSMLFVKMRSGYSAFFMGAMLLALFMLWIRAAVLIYAALLRRDRLSGHGRDGASALHHATPCTTWAPPNRAWGGSERGEDR